MIDYQSPPLLFVTSTPKGMQATVVLEGTPTTIPLTPSHALCLMVQLSHALETHLANHRNG